MSERYLTYLAWTMGALADYRPTVADLAMSGETDMTAEEVGKLSGAVMAFCTAVTARARR